MGSGIAVFWFITITGCTRPEAYYDAFREQRANFREVTAILAEIQDEKSMADATAKLKAKSDQFDATARKFEALPKPFPPEVEERYREDLPTLQRDVLDMKDQVDRVQKLKGGKAFLKQFESGQSGLFNAVQP